MFCYVHNWRSKAELPKFLTLENTLFYPEKIMTTYQRHTSGVPRDFHIVTDAADLVALYPREEVFIWCNDTNRWTNPFIQTYGADIEVIRREFFGINYSIPRAVADGKTTNVMGHEINPNSKKRKNVHA